jgi:hypothetical protein
MSETKRQLLDAALKFAQAFSIMVSGIGQAAMLAKKQAMLEELGQSNDVSAEAVKRARDAAKLMVEKLQAAIKTLGSAGGDTSELQAKCAGLSKRIDEFTPSGGPEASGEAKSLLEEAQKLGETSFAVLGAVTEPRAEEMILRAGKAEKSTTPLLKELAETYGFEPIGLEHRLKTVKSLKEKLLRDMIEEAKPLEKVAENISDALRYTAAFPPDKLIDGTLGVLRDLEKQGYTVPRLKNTWPLEGNPYKGINVQLVTPDGQKMELQFHTPESFWLKDEGTHDLYEEKRRPDISKERADNLNRIQAEMAKFLRKPDRVDNIKNIP